MRVKKSLVLLMILLGAVGVSSCKKERITERETNTNEEEQLDLSSERENAKAELDSYYTEVLGTKVDDGTVSSAVSVGKAAIDAATTTELIASALETAKTNILNAANKIVVEKTLDEVKQESKEELDSYYTEVLGKKTDDGTVSSAVSAGKTAIDEATTKELVATALETAKTNILNAANKIVLFPDDYVKGRIIYYNDFETVEEIECIKSDESPTSNIYGTVSDDSTDFTTTNSVVIGDGKLKVLDTSALTTNAYINLQQTTNNIVNVYVEITPTASNGSWSLFQLVDSNNTEIASIRTISSGKLGYRANNVQSTNSINLTANDTIITKISLNLLKQTVTVELNNTIIGTSNVSASEFTGIKLMTAGAASRDVFIDNLVVGYEDASIEEVKEVLTNNATSYLNSCVEAEYESEDYSLLVSKINLLKESISSSTNIDDLYNNFDLKMEEIKNILTINGKMDKELEDKKANILSLIDALVYLESDYSLENYEKIKTFISDAKEEIKNIKLDTYSAEELNTKTTAVSDCYSKLYQNLEAVKTKNEENQDIVSTFSNSVNQISIDTTIIMISKEDEITALYQQYNNFSEDVKSLIEASVVTKLNQLYNSLQGALAQATQLQLVEGYCESGKEELDKYYQQLDLTNYTLNIEEIRNIISKYKSSISTFLTLANQEQEASGEILASSYKSSIDGQVLNAKKDIDAVLNDLEQTRKNKLAEIDLVYNTNLSKYTASYNLSDYNEEYQALKELINLAQTIEEINGFTTDNMLAVKTDEEVIYYNSLPEYVINELKDIPTTVTFKGMTTGKIQTPITYGGKFSLVAGSAQKNCKIEALGASFFEGNEITFEVLYDGATFKAKYYSTTSTRSIILTNTVTNESTTLLHSSFVNSEAVFENLVKGTYKITFQGGEQKIESFTLIDKEYVDVAYKITSISVSTLDETYSLSDFSNDDIEVKAILENKEEKQIALSSLNIVYIKSDDLENELNEISVPGEYTIKVQYSVEGKTTLIGQTTITIL